MAQSAVNHRGNVREFILVSGELRGAEERSGEPGRMVPSSLEPALGQSTHEEEESFSYVISLV